MDTDCSVEQQFFFNFRKYSEKHFIHIFYPYAYFELMKQDTDIVVLYGVH
jgi:hypothetical protein